MFLFVFEHILCSVVMYDWLLAGRCDVSGSAAWLRYKFDQIMFWLLLHKCDRYGNSLHTSYHCVNRRKNSFNAEDDNGVITLRDICDQILSINKSTHSLHVWCETTRWMKVVNFPKRWPRFHPINKRADVMASCKPIHWTWLISNNNTEEWEKSMKFWISDIITISSDLHL